MKWFCIVCSPGETLYQYPNIKLLSHHVHLNKSLIYIYMMKETLIYFFINLYWIYYRVGRVTTRRYPLLAIGPGILLLLLRVFLHITHTSYVLNCTNKCSLFTTSWQLGIILLTPTSITWLCISYCSHACYCPSARVGTLKSAQNTWTCHISYNIYKWHSIMLLPCSLIRQKTAWLMQNQPAPKTTNSLRIDCNYNLTKFPTTWKIPDVVVVNR